MTSTHEFILIFPLLSGARIFARCTTLTHLLIISIHILHLCSLLLVSILLLSSGSLCPMLLV
uniref:Ovule protein n=1 Tax=Haemonchus contortus TaxID=6289 RepID=A0A7I4YMW2_HAECO